MEVCNATITFATEKRISLRADCALAYGGHDGELKYATRLRITLRNGTYWLTFDLAEAEEIVRLAQQAIEKANKFLEKYPRRD